MKWTKETKVYMWANYHSEDGRWTAWDEAIRVKSSKRTYNPVTRQFENKESWKHYWRLKNRITNEVLPREFKTLTAAKEYAENN